MTKSVYKQKIRLKLRFTRLLKPGERRRPPEERKFVVDSGASMYMLSKKDLSSEELDTLRRSRNPITGITASEEVQTNEEDLFVTVQILDDTPAVPSLGKLCEEHGYTLRVGPRSKTTVDQTREEHFMQNGKLRTFYSPWIVFNSDTGSSSTSPPQDSVKYIFKSRNRAK